jgi:hypothetical protein
MLPGVIATSEPAATACSLTASRKLTVLLHRLWVTKQPYVPL